jgi:hypothetical protein
MGILTTLAAVASMASRHDVAEVMLAAFADRHNVFNLQISSRTAVGAGVIELPPPSQEVGGGQVMGGATTLRHLARFTSCPLIQTVRKVPSQSTLILQSVSALTLYKVRITSPPSGTSFS